ncbi:hypothetical protein, partial [Spirosoma lituiforme]
DLKKGEFFGQLVESDVSYFRANMKPTPIDREPLPAFKEVTEADIKANYSQIVQDIKSLFGGQASEPEKISNTKPTSPTSVDDEF